MLKGHFQHKDHMGNVGELRSGGAQWMAAGRGVIHSEMPIMQDGELHGFQIWINQPARDKMKPAQYHDFQPETITEYQDENVGVLRVLAGEVSVEGNVQQGPLSKTGVPLSVSDWRSETAQKIKLLTPQKFNMMLYVYQGEISVKERRVQQGEMALLSSGEVAELNANSTSGVLIFQGEPIDEPVVHYGPFVMNSMQEIEQAISDYNNGEFEKH